jgi:hypothetical protein
VWLSYDMRGYEGVEDLTYRSLSRVNIIIHLFKNYHSRLHTCYSSWNKLKAVILSLTAVAQNLVLKMIKAAYEISTPSRATMPL